MIWHLFEVWLMVVLAFVVGCLAGAHLYNLVAGSRLALAQGAVADAVGDALDRIKARVGLAPAWRPEHLRQVERAWPSEPELVPEVDALPDAGQEPFVEAEPEFLPPPEDRPKPPRVLSPRRRPPAIKISPAQPPLLPASVVVPMRPAGLSAPRGGVPDNLQRIKGIGRRNEELLNGLGIYHFGQIAAWTPGEVEWIGRYLAFPDRIARDDWVGQATLLAMGAETGFQKSAERRRERRRREREFQSRMATAGAQDPDREADREDILPAEFPAETFEDADREDDLPATLDEVEFDPDSDPGMDEDESEDVPR